MAEKYDLVTGIVIVPPAISGAAGPASCRVMPESGCWVIQKPASTLRSLQVNYSNDNTATDLYLVRLWRLRPREDGAASFHGKLQHVVSGASCYFEKLSDLPEALKKMLSQEADLISPDANSEAMDGEETDAVPDIS